MFYPYLTVRHIRPLIHIDTFMCGWIDSTFRRKNAVWGRQSPPNPSFSHARAWVCVIRTRTAHQPQRISHRWMVWFAKLRQIKFAQKPLDSPPPRFAYGESSPPTLPTPAPTPTPPPRHHHTDNMANHTSLRIRPSNRINGNKVQEYPHDDYIYRQIGHK